MKTLLAAFLLVTLSFSATAQKDQFEIKHTTAGEIEHILKQVNKVNSENEQALVKKIAKVLNKDQAITDFSMFIHEVCLDPKKHGISSDDSDKSHCEVENIKTLATDQIAEGLIYDLEGKKDAIIIEKVINEFMNTYLEKVKIIIEAFDSWM